LKILENQKLLDVYIINFSWVKYFKDVIPTVLTCGDSEGRNLSLSPLKSAFIIINLILLSF
jgi:hypothetical protein